MSDWPLTLGEPAAAAQSSRLSRGEPQEPGGARGTAGDADSGGPKRTGLSPNRPPPIENPQNPQASQYTMRPHWSQVGSAAVGSAPLPREADSISLETFR